LRTTKAVITAASPNQRTLPLQRLVDRNGAPNTVLGIVLDEAVQAGIEEICVVICPGDEAAYQAAAGAQHAGRLCFVPQDAPRGYGHALYCARGVVGDAPFLHMVGDHIYVSDGNASFAQQLIHMAETNGCSVSGVQPTRESLLPYFGTIGGQRVRNTQDLYVIERVIEKPTPTEAEQSLMVPGLRMGQYLCFYGMHVFGPLVMELLGKHVRAAEASGSGQNIALSPVLDELAGREQYLAVETQGGRYPVDVPYGLLMAQIALALSGRDRDDVLTEMCELLAQQSQRRTDRNGDMG
jgi:UTP--glucose-1-phosphate uridylyltransferase